MKVLFFTRLYYPHVGGIEKHIEKLNEQLVDKGVKVTVLTTQFKQELTSEENRKRVKIIRFPQPNIKIIGILYTWIWILRHRKLILSSDIIHIHDVFIWYWPFRLLYPNKKVYVTFHGRWGKYPIPWVDKFQKKVGAKFSSGNICIGDYIPKNYGIKADIINYGAVQVSERKSRKDNKLIIYVGRLDSDIALEKIFKVFEKLKKDFKIVFVGDGELRKKAKIFGEVTGFTDPISYYEKTKYLFASGYLTILEGLAYRCSVFGMYDNTLQKDYYNTPTFKKFITISGNPSDMLKKFKLIKRDTKLILSGYNWVRKQTWEKMTNDYLDLWGR